MLLAAHGAIKPLGPSDPFWGSVRFLQTFDQLTVGSTISATWPNQKSGQSHSGPGALWTAVSSPSVFGVALKQTSFAFDPTITLGTSIPGLFTVEVSHRVNDSVPESHYFLSLYNELFDVVAHVFNQSGFFWVNNGTASLNTGVSINPNTWYDLAISRDGLNNMRYFINGSLIATQGNAINLTYIEVPNYDTGSAPVPADTYFIDEFRVTAACRYTSSYTPSHPFPAA